MKAVKKREWKKKSLTCVFVLLAVGMLILSQNIYAEPEGASITSNVTALAPTYTPDNRSDDGGTITTLTMTVVQQNANWKAYIGNITGTLTLDDANGNTIYQWALGTSDITGEVYSSRASSVTWSTVNCSNVTEIESEDTTLGFSGTEVDTINNTFNESTHNAITVAGRTIDADTCRSVATYESDAAPTNLSTANFQEVLFNSGTDMIYATPISKNTTSFNSTINVDFQMLLADDVTASATTYYFYVEIGG